MPRHADALLQIDGNRHINDDLALGGLLAGEGEVNERTHLPTGVLAFLKLASLQPHSDGRLAQCQTRNQNSGRQTPNFEWQTANMDGFCHFLQPGTAGIQHILRRCEIPLEMVAPCSCQVLWCRHYRPRRPVLVHG